MVLFSQKQAAREAAEQVAEEQQSSHGQALSNHEVTVPHHLQAVNQQTIHTWEWPPDFKQHTLFDHGWAFSWHLNLCQCK